MEDWKDGKWRNGQKATKGAKINPFKQELTEETETSVSSLTSC
jgi:hypothetical protein